MTLACTFDFGFCAGPAVPDSVKDIPGFLAWCKANPDKANYGSPAAGSVPHFIGVLLGQAGGIELKHVPYRGTQPAVQDMVAGQVQAVSGPVGEFTQQVNAGKSRFLGVSGATRSRFAPNVPTFAEQGYKDLVFSEWFGFFAPGGTPAPVVQRVNTALRTALEQKDVIDGLAVMGLEAKSSTPEELGDAPEGELRPLGADREEDRLHRQLLRSGVSRRGHSWPRRARPGSCGRSCWCRPAAAR